MRQCFDRARGRQMGSALSSSANNGHKSDRTDAKWDERCCDLPIYSSRPGGNTKVGLVEKVTTEKLIATVW
jgi:hypothetical protein